MKIPIEITEGCTCYSYQINGKEWVDLLKEKNEHNIQTLTKIIDILVGEIQQQYKLPKFVIDIIYDNNEFPFPISQETFIRLVKNNINTKYEKLGTCDCCGDTIESWKLNINLKYNK